MVKSSSDVPGDMKRNMARILDVLAAAEVTLNLRSSVWFGRRDMPVLGALWSVGSFTPKHERVQSILDTQRPVHLGQMQSLTAAISTLAPFIPGAQTLVAPFNKCIGEGKAVK